MNIASAAAVAYDEAAERRHLALRDEFLLDPNVVFLNHGSFGACPRPVFETYQTWQRMLEQQPVAFLGRQAAALLAHARAQLAAYLGVAADDVVYVPNPTTAINMVARSLHLRPTAVTLPGDALCRRARAAVVLCIVDGAHVPGHLPLQLPTIGADLYTGACHKWLCAPKGAAFLYARREVQAWLEPLVVSWGYE